MKIIVVIFLFALLAGCATVREAQLEPELHAVGVYEGSDPEDDGRPWHAKCGDLDMRACHARMAQRKREQADQIIINVSIEDRPLILAFTAYVKTNWIIRAKPGVIIDRIILGGYHAQSVEGIAETIPIAVYTHDDSPCANCFQGSDYFYSHEAMPAKIRNITGMQASSWQGKYRSSEFSIFPGIEKLSGSN